MHHVADTNIAPKVDALFATIADYVCKEVPFSALSLDTATLCLMDALGCGLLALNYKACVSVLGPIVPGTDVPNGVPIPGTHFILDPILAAFNIGAMIRWLDFNDTWLAAEWGHPSDNLGAILAVADFVSRKKIACKEKPLIMLDVLNAMVKAYEIQGILALENGFNRLGFDHVILVRIASVAVATYLWGGTKDQVIAALSQSFIDGAQLRTYRHAPNVGARKSWAAGDATSRAVRLAYLTMHGEKGYLSALSTKKWGFNDCLLHGEALTLPQPFHSYVMEHILFKIAYPAEFHAQTAVECAIQLHPAVKNRFADIEKIVISTQESAIRIISKKGPLHNPADRDHCLQYMIAVPLIYGDLKAAYYENTFADDPRIDALRDKMVVEEDLAFSRDYLDPQKRSIANTIQLFFKDGSKTDKVTVHYPLGHVNRRQEGIPLLYKKFKSNASTQFNQEKVEILLRLFQNQEKLRQMPVNDFMDQWRLL